MDSCPHESPEFFVCVCVCVCVCAWSLMNQLRPPLLSSVDVLDLAQVLCQGPQCSRMSSPDAPTEPPVTTAP